MRVQTGKHPVRVLERKVKSLPSGEGLPIVGKAFRRGEEEGEIRLRGHFLKNAQILILLHDFYKHECWPVFLLKTPLVGIFVDSTAIPAFFFHRHVR